MILLLEVDVSGKAEDPMWLLLVRVVPDRDLLDWSARHGQDWLDLDLHARLRKFLLGLENVSNLVKLFTRGHFLARVDLSCWFLSLSWEQLDTSKSLDFSIVSSI